MDLLADLRSRLPFRNTRLTEGDFRATPEGNQLYESEGFLVAEIDRSSLIRSANLSLSRHRGVDPADILGTSLLYLVNAEDRAELTGLVHEIFSGQPEGEAVARLLTTSGDAMLTIRWFLLPQQDAHGATVSVLCIGTDLSPYLTRSEPVQAVPTEDEASELDALREAARELQRDNRQLRKEIKQRAAELQLQPPTPPLPASLAPGEEGPLTLAEIERRHIVHTLNDTKGRVSGAKGAAAILGLHPNTLRSRMEKLGIGKVAG
jgi:hypothetical protein